jgi:heterodisulfide reductase subunit C
MAGFGFNIHKDSQIDLNKADLRIAEYVLAQEPTFGICMACGSCTATCSAGHFTDINFRKMQADLKLGILKGLKETVSACMLCGKCKLVCPRGVHTRNILLSIYKACEIFEL